MPSNHLILCCPLLLLPSVFPGFRVFSNELALRIRWPKYSSFSSVLPMKIQGWSPLRLTGLISLLSKGLYTILYRGLEHLWILVSWGVRVLELISCRYQGTTVLNSGTVKTARDNRRMGIVIWPVGHSLQTTALGRYSPVLNFFGLKFLMYLQFKAVWKVFWYVLWGDNLN